MCWRYQRSTLFPYTTLFRSFPGSSERGFIEAVNRQAISGPGSPIAASKLSLASSAAGRRLTIRTANPSSLANDSRRSEEHTSELQSRGHLVCRLLLEKKKTT